MAYKIDQVISALGSLNIRHPLQILLIHAGTDHRSLIDNPQEIPEHRCTSSEILLR